MCCLLSSSRGWDLCPFPLMCGPVMWSKWHYVASVSSRRKQHSFLMACLGRSLLELSLHAMGKQRDRRKETHAEILSKSCSSIPSQQWALTSSVPMMSLTGEQVFGWVWPSATESSPAHLCSLLRPHASWNSDKSLLRTSHCSKPSWLFPTRCGCQWHSAPPHGFVIKLLRKGKEREKNKSWK